MTTSDQNTFFAAIDLGSNSFHLLVASYQNQQLRKIDRVKEMVQIARGLNESHSLSEAAQQRALICLSRFSERLKGIDPTQIRAVGTKALRSAKNADEFLSKAEQALGHPIAIISGIEEARLIYKGVYHDIAHDGKNRLVVDIGGGSTEFIIGDKEEPKLMESLSVGCVTWANRFFPEDKINKDSLDNAQLAAQEEIEQIRKNFRYHGWTAAIGASGTIRALADLAEKNQALGSLNIEHLNKLKENMLSDANSLLKAVPKERRTVLPAGLAILIGIFKELDIQEMLIADGTLKEGLIHDSIGRISHQDSREHSIFQLQKQYHIDEQQAEIVEQVCHHLFDGLQPKSHPGIDARRLLSWAARLHEIGLSISHSGYHRHGSYLLSHMDMMGFNRFEQHCLAILVGLHRRKWRNEFLQSAPADYRFCLSQLAMILRLAVVLCRNRDPDLNALPNLHEQENYFYLTFASNYLKTHPLTESSLKHEQNYLNSVPIKLIIQ